MVLLVVEEVDGLLEIVVAEVGAPAENPDGGEGGLLAEVRALALEKLLDVGAQVPGDARRADVAEGA